MIGRTVVDIPERFTDDLLDVMNFLNEVVEEYPDAVSFAPGRPLASLFDVEHHMAVFERYVRGVAERRGVLEKAVWQEFGQYGRTNGFCNDVIATHLARDEDIHVDPDAIMVTVGAQEAMAVLLTGLFSPSTDILLTSDPTYIGITGLARILGIRVVPVETGDNGLEPNAVAKVIETNSNIGRIRAIYDIPDFNNPLGTSMPLEYRHQLLDLCRRQNILFIEDNPYGMFAYDGDRLPTLKSLDHHATVLYIGTFSKTLFPGLRVGYLVADQQVGGRQNSLAQELSRVKSLITVNTPTIPQAIVKGLLMNSSGTLEPIVQPKRAHYRRQRDAMLTALDREFSDLRHGVSWNSPAGGFFLTVTLPFEFGPSELRSCASDYGVIVCPMRFFCVSRSRLNQIRLAFSCVELSEISLGIQRLARFVRDRSMRCAM